MKVRVRIRDTASGELGVLEDEGTEYTVVRDSLYGRVPVGWQALWVKVDLPETFPE